MTNGYQTLTEKEKETLRLLGDGHDAKSIAQHFGLSVHTINERLRDARRKMAISSSRGAARLLREIENTNPHFHGYTSFGDAEAAPAMAEFRPSADLTRMSQQLGLIIGGILMSFSFALLALSQLSGANHTPASPQLVAASTPALEEVASHAAREWLSLVDAGDWNASWAATGEQFRSLNTVERWAAASQSVRAPLGQLVTRELASEEYVPAPPAGYRVVKFRTSYAQRRNAIETLSLVLEAGNWKVVGYTIE